MKLTIESCGRIFAVLVLYTFVAVFLCCLGLLFGSIAFALWAALRYGAQ